MSILLLDALNVPAPAQLVTDCRDAGASGCWAYTWRPWGSPWTPAHVEALHEAGLLCPALIVPGNGPGPWQTIVNSASALGCDPITAFDIETNSLPPAEWLAGAIAYTRQLGRRPVRYGDAPVLSGYPQADGDWISHRPGLIVRAGTLDPIPAVPAGTIAWQYAVECSVNGHEYDASAADPSFFGGDDVDPATLQALQGFLKWWGDELAPNFPYIQQTNTDVPNILDAVEKLQAPTVDTTTLAGTLAGNTTFVNAIADAVLARLASKLGPPPA